MSATRSPEKDAMQTVHSPVQGAGGRRTNVRTALVLLSVAVVFFLGIIAKYWLFG